MVTVKRIQLACTAALVGFCFSSGAYSEGEVTPFASFTATSDDNLYRLNSSSNPVGLSKSDVIYQTAAGVSVDWRLSRQEFALSGSIIDSKFKNNNQLDNLGGGVNGRWNWVIGNRFSGVISASESISLPNFEETVSQEKTKRTTRNLSASGNWRYHPDWRIGSTFSAYSSDYDSISRKNSDFKKAIGSVNLDYLVSSGSRVGLKVQTEKGEFVNRVNTVTNDREYTQTAFLLTTLWNISGKSDLVAELGHVSREHPNITERDYSGLNASVKYNWSVTGKLDVSTEAFRRTDSTEDVSATYSEDTGVKLGLSWALTEKLMVSGSASKGKRNLSGQTGIILESTLEDRYSYRSVNLNYSLNRNIDVALGYSHNSRDSNRLYREYYSNLWSLSLKVKL